MGKTPHERIDRQAIIQRVMLNNPRTGSHNVLDDLLLMQGKYVTAEEMERRREELTDYFLNDKLMKKYEKQQRKLEKKRLKNK
jgi:hypothetical protein